jgi:hypothetical protein
MNDAVLRHPDDEDHGDLSDTDNFGNLSMKAWSKGDSLRGGIIINGDDRGGPPAPLAGHGTKVGSTGNGKRQGTLGTPVCHGALA